MNSDQFETGIPAPQGLYDFEQERDACGVGLVADLKNEPSHKIIEMGITVLKRLMHRGAVGSDPDTGDGAGILLALPDEILPPGSSQQASRQRQIRSGHDVWRMRP